MMLMVMASVSAVIVSASLLLRTAVCVTSAVRAEGVAAACSEAAEAAATAEAVLAACTCEKYHLLWPSDKVAPHFTTHKTGAVMKLSISTATQCNLKVFGCFTTFGEGLFKDLLLVGNA